MIGPSRSPPPVLATEGPRDDTPPPAPDVTADPRQPKSQLSTPSPRIATPEKEAPCITFPPVGSHPCRNNEVRSVMLYGIPIVALVIDAQERLCLAQISNTLLKDFSYNEIHNRRVALGITCVQCTPVQLELLRRAGAMPVSSRRCGMITKREAERLCKSFLVDTSPPKLPDNFAFDVYHQCAWGCRGSFVPSRYNSSRAKCIKCAYCGLFFSPNKFIFHSHRLPDSKYVQPDAANFNSWRRHIRLSGGPPDEVMFAWEDVKAMFNGGSRKRVMASAISSFSRNHHEIKRSRMTSSTAVDLPTSSASGSNPLPKQSLFPLVPLPNKSFSLPSSPPLIPPPAPFSLTGKPVSPTDIRQNFAEYMWSGKHPFPVPYGAVLWPRPPGMTPSVVDAEARSPESNSSGQSSSYRALEAVHRPLSSSSDGASCSLITERDEEVGEVIHPSAFRPVGRGLGRLQVERSADTNPDTTTSGEIDRYENDDCHGSSDSDQDEVDVTDISNDSSSDKIRRVVDVQNNSDNCPSVEDIVQENKKASGHRQTETASPTSTEGERFAPGSSFDLPKLSALSKEELHEVLLQEAQARRKAEVEYQLMRETFEVQVRKEIAYREEIAKQLQLVRDSLCQELDQERKARFAIQQRLKEAHDTLQHFSCKLLNSRHCSDCTLKPMLPE